MTIDFVEAEGAYSGTGAHGRRWRITPTYTGWRMEFLDHGDSAPTNAGVYPTLAAAQAEAGREPARGRRRPVGG